VLGLLHVLVDKRREMVLDNIIDEFAKYRDEHEGRVHARVTTAKSLDDAERERLVAALGKTTGKTVELHEKIDPAVIGGIRVNLGDYVLDGTVRRRLNELRRSFAAEQG
jgi:F-type H+-transporting ATPase subunit delta